MIIPIEAMIIIGVEAVAIIFVAGATYSSLQHTKQLTNHMNHRMYGLEARLGKQAERLASMEGVLNTILTSIRSKH
jgi:hypothetical protein